MRAWHRSRGSSSSRLPPRPRVSFSAVWDHLTGWRTLNTEEEEREGVREREHRSCARAGPAHRPASSTTDADRPDSFHAGQPRSDRIIRSRPKERGPSRTYTPSVPLEALRGERGARSWPPLVGPFASLAPRPAHHPTPGRSLAVQRGGFRDLAPTSSGVWGDIYRCAVRSPADSAQCRLRFSCPETSRPPPGIVCRSTEEAGLQHRPWSRKESGPVSGWTGQYPRSPQGGASSIPATCSPWSPRPM